MIIIATVFCTMTLTLIKSYTLITFCIWEIPHNQDVGQAGRSAWRILLAVRVRLVSLGLLASGAVTLPYSLTTDLTTFLEDCILYIYSCKWYLCTRKVLYQLMKNWSSNATNWNDPCYYEIHWKIYVSNYVLLFLCICSIDL